MDTGIIILAAGNSSRLGRPKQLLFYQTETLLERVIKSSMRSPFRPVIVVLGAYAEQIFTLKLPDDVTYSVNENWQKGMSTSISAGITSLLNQHPEIENVIIAVADQVFITPDIFIMLLEKKKQTDMGIISSSYGQTTGTPVLFNRKYFGQLQALQGDQGAKVLLKRYAEDTATIRFDLGNIDIDDEYDYLKLIDL